jgi:PPM family protein phosphatase
MNPESIYHLFEVGNKVKQEDYIWPVAGEATANDKVFIVCDGAGSFHNGANASKLICQFMAAKVLKFPEHKMSGELIDELLVEARDRLITYARVNRLDTDLATTFAMLILYDQRVFMSWCGDSRIYHLRNGEILYRNEDNSLPGEPMGKTIMTRGIQADSSPIYAETKWIEDVQDGDYFLLCTKGITENVTDDDIKLLVSQNDKANVDLTGSFRRLAFEKTPDNCSMYVIRVNVGKQKRGINNGIFAIRKPTGGMSWPIFVLAATIVGLLVMVFYFRIVRTHNPEPKKINQATQPMDVQREDSVPSAIVMSVPKYQPKDVQREDSVPSAIVMSAPRKTVLKLTDSVKSNSEIPQADLQNDNTLAIQDEEKPAKANPTPIVQNRRVIQMLIKLTTDESCKLKITNIDLDEVIDWDLSPKDNGTIFLKPGKYSIVATSEIDSSKTKTFHFDVKPENAHTTQSIHIKF